MRDNSSSISKLKKFCKCGCGELLPIPKFPCLQARFLHGHNIGSLHQKGSKSSHWKGGTPKASGGYILEYCPEHLFADKSGYVLQHRIVWERSHKACLLKWSNIHHKNHIRNDNRIENLEAMTSWSHGYHHSKQDFSNRFCYNCNQKTYTDYRNYECWYRHPITKQEHLCRKCYRKICWKLNKSI